jgi:hypothetical protein
VAVSADASVVVATRGHDDGVAAPRRRALLAACSAILLVAAAGCSARSSASNAAPAPPGAALNGLSITFPAGTCKPTRVGNPLSTWTVVTAGIQVDGAPG